MTYHILSIYMVTVKLCLGSTIWCMVSAETNAPVIDASSERGSIHDTTITYPRPGDSGNPIDNITQTNLEIEFENHLPEDKTEFSNRTTVSPNITIDVPLPEIVTCQGKCGQIIEWPCSCDVKCHVHGNCCENMIHDCPGIIIEARSRFDTLLRSDVVCSQHGYFVISSCPHNDERPVEEVTIKSISPTSQLSSRTFFDVTPSSGNWGTSEMYNTNNASRIVNKTFPKPLPENHLTQNATLSLIEFLRINAPVVDVSTGFVFANEKIFHCHGGIDSKGLVWNAEIAAINTMENIMSLEVLERVFDREDVIYLPPSLPNDTVTMTRCNVHAINTCSKERAETEPELKELCQSFISYVKTDRNIYANRFCAECSGEHNNEPLQRYVFMQKGAMFSATFSLSQTSKISLISHGPEDSGYFPWKEANCNIITADGITEEEEHQMDFHEEGVDQHSPSQGNMICNVESCADWYQMRPDGTCKILHEVSVAFADDGFPFTSSEISHLPDAVSCFLENAFGIEITDTTGPTETVFDTDLNKRLYLVKIGAFLPHNRFDLVFLVEPDKHYSKLANLAKAFREQRKERMRLACTSSRKVKARVFSDKFLNDTTNCRANTSKDYDNNDKLRHTESIDMLNIFPSLRDYFTNRKLLDNSTTTVCSSTHPDSQSASFTLLCLRDPLHETDVSMIEELVRSHCMTILQEDARNGLSQHCLTYVTAKLLVVATVVLQLIMESFTHV